MTASPTDDLASAERRIQELTNELSLAGGEVSQARGELAEAREQQAATGGILRVISSSPADLQPVFAEIAASAARLCDAYDAVIRQVDGEVLRLVAHHGPISTPDTIAVSRSSVIGCAVMDRRTIHVADLQSEADEYLESRNRALELGHRTALGVPLVHAGKAVGVILIRRTEVHPFTDRQIELLKTFADQAVIAIENTRLFEAEQASKRELRESLEYQTAISEVLSVISRSPNDLDPVLKAIGEIACRLCAAYDVSILLRRGDKMRLMFNSGPIGGYPVEHDFALTRRHVVGRAVIDAAPVHVADLQVETEEFPEGAAIAAEVGHRTILAVPLLQANQAIGTIVLRRLEVQPFAPNQVALLKTFADQAVIAIENTRLFEAEQARTKELRDSLEYQTATSDVLGIISRSPSELQPVFDGIVTTAQRLCEAYDASIVLRDEGRLKLKAHVGPIPMRAEWPLGNPGLVVSRAVMAKTTVHVHDLAAPGGEFPEGREDALKLGHRSILAVPLVLKGEGIGTLIVRRFEVRPFGDRQIALLATFADQAVIAIENTRLFEEVQARNHDLRIALEQQTATSELLKVIGRSTFDLQPVFEMLIESAVKLCGATRGFVSRFDGRVLRFAAGYNVTPELREYFERNPFPIDRHSNTGHAALERRTIHNIDVRADPEYTYGGARVDPYRTVLAIPMLKSGSLLGVILIYRHEVLPFTDSQIALMESFADQAVIAIENTRLFEAEQASKRELQESLEYQTATSEVLNVISRSPTELQPVLDAIAATAARLCESKDALVWRVAGGRVRVVAEFGSPTPASTLPLTRGSVTGRAIVDRKTIHVHDLAAMVETEYPDVKERQQRVGHRTALVAPLLSQGEALGAISVRRNQVHPFSDRQIALLQTFADQAVIAIENTRLFEAEQASKRELQESLEYQTATTEVLDVISRSPTNSQPVLDTIAASIRRLSGSTHGSVFLFDGEQIHLASHAGMDPAAAQALAQSFPQVPGPGGATARALLSRQVAYIPDVLTDGEYRKGDVARAVGYRSIVSVPMLRDGHPVGAITATAAKPAEFSERQIALLQTFANQAVIAINNAGLFEEVQARTRELTESLEQQTATADVLKVISRSALDVQKVLDALVESAARLCNAYDAAIFQVFGDGLRLVAHHGQIPTIAPVGQLALPLARGLITGRAVIDRRTIHVADILAEGHEYPDARTHALQLGSRTALAVPLVHAGEAIGVIYIRRAEVRPFTERQIELVNIFADQAVIAIENTRLFEEVQARTRELAKTVEDLEIASQHKNQFVANMSHELRTPLAAILGYAELMQEGFYEPLGQKSLDALTRIRSNGKHLLGLINTVLDIAKIESGQFTLNMTEYAIASVVETVRAATESLAQNKKLTLTTSVDKSLPVGLGDEQRLTQVLLNLVGNAIKFTDAGEVSVAAGARNGRFAVSVTDTGPGIPLDQQDRIFEQFHQVDSSNTKAKGGTGLGLAIAKQIVEMHGGRIWVVSTPGKGSTFQMELPTRAEFRKPVQPSMG